MAELAHDSKEAEQKSGAQGIQTIIMSFALSIFFSDGMPQLTIFCKALQSEDISLEGDSAGRLPSHSCDTP